MGHMNNQGCTGTMEADVKEILITEEEIQSKVRELGKQISTDYAGKTPVFVGVLKGVLFFMRRRNSSIVFRRNITARGNTAIQPLTHGRGGSRAQKK